MNLATRLTFIRIGMVPFFIIFLYIDNVYTRICALLTFIIAGITDLYDGAIARRTNTITTLGTFLDPLADKLMISAAFILFIELPEIAVPAWMVILIISREFIITGLRSVAASKGKILAADKHGKFKTSSQVTAIITILVILICNAVLSHFWDIDVYQWIYALDYKRYIALVLIRTPFWIMLIVTMLTIISGSSYLINHWDLISERRKKPR
ncbi:MAG: CDP-diacylglycerol--glycerol-3-phosphate 3-phosphatidyltransferase [Elusimicrobia bacterium]|nr:CDP-diacylglycerol--glycerol-3-phosphate 3-phosphatidyltransferase [Elusimicrobiota bacterium]MBD3412571.1 CDP-diacylglycerol--glycerol-3-phosphate 3-phosphatidyltransferase [Elusimicrobiota bacterium]